MELPKWWIKFEETCSLVIIMTMAFTILLGGLFRLKSGPIIGEEILANGKS